MHMNRKRRGVGNRASTSVEMGLVSVVILLPMIAGIGDFLDVIAAKAQINAALQAFDAYAWNDPSNATNTSALGNILGVINRHSLPIVTFPDGKTDGTTSYTPVLTYYCTTPPSAVQTAQTTPCGASQNQAALEVTYKVQSDVALPVPMPLALTSPFLLTASGKVELQ
jgi:hypothetical protein